VRGLPLFGYVAIALLLRRNRDADARASQCSRSRLTPLSGRSCALGLAQLRGAPGQAGVSLAAIVAA